MAATPGVENIFIRCPVCLAKQEIAANADPLSNVVCKQCKRHFRVMGALNQKPASQVTLEKLRTAGAAAPAAKAIPTTVSAGIIGAILVASFLGGYIVRYFEGPEFLLYYFLVFCATLAVVSLYRWTKADNWCYSIYGFLLFEGIGVSRIFTSSHPGIKKYDYLIMGMFFGGLMFFLRAKGDGSGGYGVFGSCALNSSGSGSCSSSCSGGGGCGGCGGCGCGGGGCGG